MISTQLASIGLAAALVAVIPAVSAQAQAPRTFVSAAGSDSNPCTFASPCRHFQAAVTATTVGGEVDALDPAGYGPITISQAITIEGQGWSYIAPPAGGNAITINAVSGNIAIHGVSLNGAGISGGTNGIVFNSGGSLIVKDCVAQNFTGNGTSGNGILMQPTSSPFSFVITNADLSNNGETGIGYVTPGGSTITANGVIDHVVATGNLFGIAINPSSDSGQTTVAISNAVVSNNRFDGIYLQNASASLAVSIDNTSASANGTAGIEADSTSNVILSRSVITGNPNYGVFNGTNPNTFYSYQDNRINGNNAAGTGADINTPLNYTRALK